MRATDLIRILEQITSKRPDAVVSMVILGTIVVPVNRISYNICKDGVIIRLAYDNELSGNSNENRIL